MHILSSDLYIHCSELIEKANKIYDKAKEKEMHGDDTYYIESMKKNSYEKYKERQIKQCIKDIRSIHNRI